MDDKKLIDEFERTMPPISEMVEEGFFWTMATLETMRREFKKNHGFEKSKMAADEWLGKWIDADSKNRKK